MGDGLAAHDVLPAWWHHGVGPLQGAAHDVLPAWWHHHGVGPLLGAACTIHIV